MLLLCTESLPRPILAAGEHSLLSETNSVDGKYMVFEMLQVIENKPLRLAYWVTTFHPGLRILSFEVTAFNVIHHLRRATKRAHPVFVTLRFVANAERALSLTTNEREDTKEWISVRRLLLDEKGRGRGDAAAVSWSHLTTTAKSLHEFGGLDPALDSVLRGDIRDASTDQVDQLRPLGDLMLNHRLNVLLLLLSAVLPLNVFGRAAAEIICSVFFRDNISTPAPSTTDCGGKSPNFCLNIRPLNSVCPCFQLFSLLLECGDVWIGGERSQDVVRYVNRGAGIAHKAHMREHAKDAVGRRTLEDGRLDVEPHPLIDVGPIIHGRVWIVSHDLIPNGIGSST
jgi:hypothetical protein